ncbi:hypothetical protein AV521_15525 [Streptomyces sp. IMTB 2501]|nr:hypothetical protein AV521_15525 [Streptomyces sp. IMTB 2501]
MPGRASLLLACAGPLGQIHSSEELWVMVVRWRWRWRWRWRCGAELAGLRLLGNAAKNVELLVLRLQLASSPVPTSPPPLTSWTSGMP